MYYKIGRPLSISDLDRTKAVFKRFNRSDAKILVIDDEPFQYLDFLREHEFNIKYVEDIDAIEHVSNYDIIICDIRGVGKRLGTKNQGAHIISEIRKKYPFKTILAYTGYQHDPAINKYLLLADDLYKKDIDGDDLLEKLDVEVKKITNIDGQWLKIRKYLIEQNLKIYDVALLENDFVSILNGGGNIRDFHISKQIKNFPSDVRAVLQSFVASAIFSLSRLRVFSQ